MWRWGWYKILDGRGPETALAEEASNGVVALSWCVTWTSRDASQSCHSVIAWAILYKKRQSLESHLPSLALFPSIPTSHAWVDQFIFMARWGGHGQWWTWKTQALVKGWGMVLPQPWSLWCNMQGPAYSRHTLPGDTEPGEHPKEILILRHKSLRVEVSGGDMTISRTEVRGSGDGLDLQRPCAGIMNASKSALFSGGISF